MTLAARILYAQCWKLQKIPEIEEWILKFEHLLEIDKITRKLKEENDEDFLRNWNKVNLENNWMVKRQ